MITLQFPKMDKAVQKSIKDLPDDDPRRGITVLNQNAIVYQSGFCLVINLYDYFNLDCNIEDEEELEDLENILFYMDGKTFSPEYWAELTKGANMEMRNGLLYIENPKYAKDLHYKDVEMNLFEPLDNLNRIRKKEGSTVPSVALPFGALKSIYDVLPADFKNDEIVLDFIAMNEPVKFTFRLRKHVYGYIRPDYDAAAEQFKYEHLQEFVDTPEFKTILEDSKPSLPPSPAQFANESIETQEDLFGGDITKHYE